MRSVSVQWWQPRYSDFDHCWSRIRLLPSPDVPVDQTPVALHHIRLPNNKIVVVSCTDRYFRQDCVMCDLAKEFADNWQWHLAQTFEVRCGYATNILVLDDPADHTNNHQVRAYLHNHNMSHFNTHDPWSIEHGVNFAITATVDLAQLCAFDQPSYLCNGDTVDIDRVLDQRWKLSQLANQPMLPQHRLDQIINWMVLSHG